ncbi:hypothetical protein A3731_34310 [Roseovarius sp. HI0049]|nr:hypothetical protein A3731_15915 [Roseovarius sp. HI0049]KZY43513.1 hypothetical protein A3731_34310 [Roseovarius sp. HI0049]
MRFVLSAPKTNIEKQERRHKVPLIGMVLVVLFASALLAALIIWLGYQGNEPGNAAPEIDGRTGAEEQVDGS